MNSELCPYGHLMASCDDGSVDKHGPILSRIRQAHAEKFISPRIQLLTFNGARLTNWGQRLSEKGAPVERLKHASPWRDPLRARLSKGNCKPPLQFELCSTSTFN